MSDDCRHRRGNRLHGTPSSWRKQFVWWRPKNFVTNARMTSAARFLIVTGIVLTGCGTARDVAVTSFRVIDAPANYVRRKLDAGETTTTTTTTTQTAAASSDVVNPGRPVNPRSQSAPGTQPSAASTAPTGTPRPPRRDPAATANATPAPQRSAPAPTTTQFPTARPVPGKPGFVYSVDPKGGIVDVTGYKSGDKAKDPYTQQIFVVP